MQIFEQCGYTSHHRYLICGVLASARHCAVLELALMLEHVAAPPSGHQQGPTRHDAPPVALSVTAPSLSGSCCVRARMSCLHKHRCQPARTIAASKLKACTMLISFSRSYMNYTWIHHKINILPA